ncbi:MAG TPA: hypothetical protein VE090_02065 [Methylomirabilota bacterium]|nr:hypothetical protein [Methylomirabilota bacterium]
MNPPDIKKLIEIVKTGDRQGVKKAQRAIESAWHNYYIPHRKEGKKAFEVFLDEVKTFDQIQDIDHQAYFISSLKWAFWTIGEEYFETWAEFVLKCIQHPSGKIRQAVIHIADVLVTSLDVYVFNKKETKTEEEKRMIRETINLQRFGRLVMSVEDLVQHYYEPKYKRYKYVSSMPIGVYKSLQILITEKLLPSEHYENLYKEFYTIFK